jgi:hypothetical protein
MFTWAEREMLYSLRRVALLPAGSQVLQAQQRSLSQREGLLVGAPG